MSESSYTRAASIAVAAGRHYSLRSIIHRPDSLTHPRGGGGTPSMLGNSNRLALPPPPARRRLTLRMRSRLKKSWAGRRKRFPAFLMASDFYSAFHSFTRSLTWLFSDSNIFRRKIRRASAL